MDFTKEQAAAAHEAAQEIFDAVPETRKSDFTDRLHTIYQFLDAATRAAPSETPADAPQPSALPGAPPSAPPAKPPAAPSGAAAAK